MKRDTFGICLSKSMLSTNLSSTFTHVRAYEKSKHGDNIIVMRSYPQLSGKELITTIDASRNLLWRAEFICKHQAK
ncbi:hypothetical protein [Vibrio sp.]|uniref:hypothetical protein n=1 Tax=Vibrio sp. TaxID=678 RepID=UPI00311DDC61